jgi:hypothetical protein
MDILILPDNVHEEAFEVGLRPRVFDFDFKSIAFFLNVEAVADLSRVGAMRTLDGIHFGITDWSPAGEGLDRSNGESQEEAERRAESVHHHFLKEK